jgi:TatA/E family protein of Tat protein translocase
MFRNPLTDTIVVLVVVLLIFGPKRLPQLGHGLREFRDSLTGSPGSDEEPERVELTGSTTAVASSTDADSTHSAS